MELRRIAAPCLALLLAACGGSASPSIVHDAGADAADTDGPDASGDGSDAVEFEAPDFEAPDVAVASAWEPLQITWLAGTPHPADDGAGTREALARGWFAPPLPGTDADRVSWTDAAPDEEGVFEGLASQRVFLAGTFATEGHTGLIVQADAAFTVWVDGRRQPGDIYRSGRMRVPFALQPGDHWIVVEAFPPRGAPRVRLWTTPDDLAIHPGDATVPDLVVGNDDPQVLGVPVLNLGEHSTGPLRARIVDPSGQTWDERATFTMPGIAPGAVSQIGVPLVPLAAWAGEPGSTVDVTVRIEPAELDASYEHTFTLDVVAVGATHRRTFRSSMDDSAQYYAVVPPTRGPDASHGIVLSLHGAGVEALGQARAYSPKPWAWIVAPTNRRPFGFDWEVFGRRDAIEVLEDAQAWIEHDPRRVHVTGHSMGGHGTWQLGTLFPDRFATVGPSAGWDSFYSYTGDARPTGILGRAQASSVSSDYVSNLAGGRVYIIHGDADTNVPVREGRTMYQTVSGVTSAVTYHEEPGAGHWWDGDASEGADCVDWPPLFAVMEEERLPEFEDRFTFRTPSPWVSPTYAWATITSVETPLEDAEIEAVINLGQMSVFTTNVRGLRIDAAALREGGVTGLAVNTRDVDMSEDVVLVGEVAEGKREGLTGPLPQLFERPFCFVVDRDDADAAAFAAWMTSSWSVLGNGSASTVSSDALEPWMRERCQPVYVGVDPAVTAWDETTPLAWDERGASVGDARFEGAAAVWLYPEQAPSGRWRLAGAWTAPADRPDLRYLVTPFQSRFVVPDLLLWDDSGARAGGFFDAQWQVDPALGWGL